MKEIRELPLPGAYLLTLPFSEDARGTFIKTFHETTLTQRNIYFTIRESYFSISKKDVIRGMHFQLPPAQHSKIVFCPLGAIMDVIVDMRKGSPTYREHFAYELSGDNNMAFFIPEGFAHGFKTLTDNAMTYYLVSSEYSKEHDTGILYNSIGFDWQIEDPIISDRDLSFVKMDEFDSPFRFEP